MMAQGEMWEYWVELRLNSKMLGRRKCHCPGRSTDFLVVKASHRVWRKTGFDGRLPARRATMKMSSVLLNRESSRQNLASMRADDIRSVIQAVSCWGGEIEVCSLDAVDRAEVSDLQIRSMTLLILDLMEGRQPGFLLGVSTRRKQLRNESIGVIQAPTSACASRDQ